MFGILKQVLQLLDRREKIQAGGVLGLTVIMAFLELVGIATVLPFIAVLSAPEKIHENKWGQYFFDALGFESDRGFLIFLGAVALFFLVVSNAFKALTRWVILRFSQLRSYTLSQKLLTQYLYQPYSFFLLRNSSQLRKSLGEIQSMVTNVLIPLMDLAARICVCAAIMALLIFANPVLAMLTALILGSCYGVIYFSMRRWLFRLGQNRLEILGKKNKLTAEAFLGIKNLKLTGAEKYYLDLHSDYAKTVAKATSLNTMASDLPRYFLEIIAFGGILFIILYELLDDQDIRHALPMISLYALAGYRLMPNFQAAFASLTKLRFNTALLNHAAEEFSHSAAHSQESYAGDDTPALAFADAISLRQVGFRYESADQPVISAFDLDIPANTTLAIIGKTGSGKTTLVDMIIGLLSPSDGAILIDGVALSDTNRRAWQKNIAYVTQHIYLNDDTIARNIALGFAESDIDYKRIEQAARMASLHDFIETLPHGYHTSVGENGVRFSGGQRQRIGIARALYLNRPVLVLDEATSALDQETEEAVMDAIRNLDHQKTIILITHRLSSIEGIENVLDLTPPAAQGA